MVPEPERVIHPPRACAARCGAPGLQAFLRLAPLPLTPLLLASALATLTAATAHAQSTRGVAATLDASAVGAQVGREVGRRWCAGENAKQAIEEALVAYLDKTRLTPSDLSQQTTKVLGKEIAVEAFGQAFAACPQRAREIFRTMMD